jgi:polyphosphate kinase
VHANIDRFLEHARIFRFENAGNPELFISSADWMPRNFHRRVEVLTPLLDARVKQRVQDILDVLFADVAKTWVLSADGKYERIAPLDAGSAPRAQQRFIEQARERAKMLDPLARPSHLRIFGSPGAEQERKLRRARERQKKKSSS